MNPLLEVRDLCTEYRTPQGSLRAVDTVNFDVHPSEVVAVVGASGSGKSALLRSLIGLTPAAPGVVAGSVVYRFGEQEVQPYARRGQRHVDKAMQPLRGRHIGMILQDGRTALDPLRTLEEQIDQPLEWLELLGYNEPQRYQQKRDT